MSFREKSAWIFLISISLVGGFYFLHVPWSLAPAANPHLVRALFYCIGALLVIEGVGHLVIALLAPEEARAPRDERERFIDLRATRVAHYIYVAGSLLAVSMIHHGANAVFMGFGVLLAFMIAEIVKYALRILYHRRGF